MAKTGNAESLGTAEGAVLGRASHALHADPPILDDTWAVLLLGPESQARARDPEYSANAIEREGFDPGPVFALNVGSLRYAEDEVERAVDDAGQIFVNRQNIDCDEFLIRMPVQSNVAAVFVPVDPDRRCGQRADFQT